MQALPKLGWPPHPLIQASWAIWPIISRKCDSRQFSTKVRKSFLRVKMLNRCGFWGKKGHFCGEIITFGWWMITFEGPQCMWTNPSQKSRQGSDPPPIQAMPEFWEHLDLAPLPKLEKPLTFKLLIHLLVLIHRKTHTEGTFYCLKENGKISQSFDKSQQQAPKL